MTLTENLKQHLLSTNNNTKNDNLWLCKLFLNFDDFDGKMSTK